MDNDMWFTNMEIAIYDLLARVPAETFMVAPFGDVNSIFFIRNSVGGRAFLDRWLKIGIEDGATPCRHDNFVILVHFRRCFRLDDTPHAPCALLYLVPMLIVC